MDNIISLPIPSYDLIKHLQQKTDTNDHSGARWTVANWIVERLREQGRTMADAYYAKAMSSYRVFEAIVTIHVELGYLPHELYELRSRRTEEMLTFVGKINPEAAELIRKAL